MGAVKHPIPKGGQKRVQFCYFNHEKSQFFKPIAVSVQR